LTGKAWQPLTTALFILGVPAAVAAAWRHLVAPVRVPRPGVGRVVGEQVRVISQLDADGASSALISSR